MAEITLDPEVTIAYVAELKKSLQDQCEQADDIIIDASAVIEFDGAGLQLLIAFKKWCDKYKKNLQIINHSEIVSGVFQLVGADAFFGDPIVIKAEEA